MLTLSNRLKHLKIAYDLILIRFLRILFMKKRFLPKKGVEHPYHTTDDVMVMMAMTVDGSGCESKNSKEDNDSDGKRLSNTLDAIRLPACAVDTLLKSQIMKAQVKHGPVFFYYLILF